MMKLHKILFPIDFSERSRAAAPFVLAMARRYHSNVVLLHAIHPPPPIYGGMDTIYPEQFDFNEYRISLKGELEKFGAAELPKVDITCAVAMGDTATIINDYVEENAIDLIAMPTHGYGVFRRALLGSVTVKVLHDAKIPVWTSAHAPEQSHRAHPQPRRIIVGLDLRPESKKTLEAAIQLGLDSGATVSVVHAVTEGFVVPGMAKTQLE
jgi:nucleotide-binding universal stress UspA family protein